MLLGESLQALTERQTPFPPAVSAALGQPVLALWPGEEVIARMSMAYVDPTGPFRLLGLVRGVFFLSAHRVGYKDSLSLTFRLESPLIQVLKAVACQESRVLRVVLQDSRVLEVGFDAPHAWVAAVADKLNRCVKALRKDAAAGFASAFRAALAEDDPRVGKGWDQYRPLQEFARLGLTSKGWRLVVRPHVFTSLLFLRLFIFHFCSVLFSCFILFLIFLMHFMFLAGAGAFVFAVPEVLSEHQISVSKCYREHQRMPAVVWRHPGHHAVLARAAQPYDRKGSMVRVETDEVLLASIRLNNPNTDTLLLAAWAVASRTTPPRRKPSVCTFAKARTTRQPCVWPMSASSCCVRTTPTLSPPPRPAPLWRARRRRPRTSCSTCCTEWARPTRPSKPPGPKGCSRVAGWSTCGPCCVMPC